MECCGHAEIVYAFQSIEKKVKKGSIKEYHGAVDKSSSEQQFRKCDGITFAVLNFWSRTLSGTRLAGWHALIVVCRSDVIRNKLMYYHLKPGA